MKVLQNRWIYMLKIEENDSTPQYKARLIVKDGHQKKDVDFDEIFSSVVKWSSIRVVLGLTINLEAEVGKWMLKLFPFVVIWRKKFTSSNLKVL